MSPIKTRSSVLGVKVESAEGTLNLSSASGDFVALQDGFTFAPETENLENAELRSSIGQAKPIAGVERANAEFSHYIRHSGVEGQEPNYGDLLYAAFGSKDVEATEYDTVSGSTTTVLNVDTGEGANFRRGQGLLIKDTTRSLRCVDSVSGDALTLNFALGSAPGTGVNLGKCVGFIPANSGHPTLTLDLYRGNGGMREVIGGARVTQFSMDVAAGELINGGFTLQGVKYYFNPINITSSNCNFRFYDGTLRTVSVSQRVYRDPHELAEALDDALNDSASADEFTVVYNDYGASKGKFTVTSDGGTFELRFNGASNSIATTIGFTATDHTGATTYTSDTAQSWAASATPAYDDADPRAAKSAEVLFGEQDDNVNVCVREMTITMDLERAENECVGAETGIDSSEINGRTVAVDMTATAEQHEARFFRHYRTGDNIKFQFGYGEKLGGNFQAGTCVVVYIPTATIQTFEPADGDGTVVFNMTAQAYVDNQGQAELFLNYL